MISSDDVKKLASLARIKVAPEEEAGLAKDMDAVLEYVEQIQDISATGSSTDPTNSSIKEKTRNVMREDTTPHESGAFSEEILAEAPEREGNYVKVKKIL